MAGRVSPRLMGQLAGLFAVLSWGSYLALARAGVNQGLHLPDFLLLRYGLAGVLMLPFLVGRGPALRELGWGRALVLTVLVGPPFLLLGVGGYRFAPLAHGAVMQPVTVTIVVVLVAALFMGEAMTRQRAIGVVLAVLGVVLVGFGARGPVDAGSGPTWLGDLLFIGAGLLWAGFTLLLRRWRLDPVLATGVVSVLSSAAVVPWFLATQSFDRLLSLPPGMLAVQALVQGVLSGLIAVVAFGFTIKHLGAGAAALFPSMVPAAATLIGLPITHEVPAPLQVVGLVMATLGLVGTMVRFGPRRPVSPASGPDDRAASRRGC